MYEEKNFDTIIDNMLNRVSEVSPDIDTREGSVIYNALAPAAIEMQDLYIALDTVLNESFADTQSREFLIRRCAERGIFPNEATYAIRKGEFTGEYNIADVIGEEFSLGQLNYICERCEKSYIKLECDTPGEEENDESGSLQPIGNIEGLESSKLIVVHTTENNNVGESVTNTICLAELSGTFNKENFNEELLEGFSSDSHQYMVVGKLSGDELDKEELKAYKDIFRLKCTTKGKAGNYDTGDLIPVEYIEGLETVKLTEMITPGRDEEDTEHLRQRYFDNVNAFAFGGNIADYKTKVLSLSSSENGQGNEAVRTNGGVGYVKVEPAGNGAGTVKIIILDSDYHAPLNGDSTADDYLTGHPLVEAVQEAIDPIKGVGAGIAPIGHKVTVYSAKEEKINIFASVVYVNNNNDSNKSEIENALEKYFTSRIKEWKNDDDLEITIGDIYMCIQAVPCVQSIEAIQEITLNGKSSVTIKIDSIPVLGGFDDGKSNEIN